MFSERWWEYHMFSYGSIGEGIVWKQIYGEYKADRLESATELLESVGVGTTGSGVGFSRMIQAEYGTRKASFKEKQSDSLILEMRQQSPLGRWDELKEAAEKAFKETSDLLGFDGHPVVLITLILEELDTPWTPGRFGYHTNKIDYHKICLPESLMERPTELHKALMHEYAHAISSELTQETCPRWLDEAVAMAVSGSLYRAYREDFQHGRAEWLNQIDLDVAYNGAIGDPEEGLRMQRAYAQSSWIGEYLLSLKGTKGLGDLLRAFGDNSFWDELRIQMLGMMRAEEALRQTYKFGVEEVFDRAKAFMNASSAA